MFHEREHSLHHSHEMAEKVGGGGQGGGRSLRWLWSPHSVLLPTGDPGQLQQRNSADFLQRACDGNAVTPSCRRNADAGTVGGSPAVNRIFPASCRKQEATGSIPSEPAPSNGNCASPSLCKPELNPGQRAALFNTNSGGAGQRDLRRPLGGEEEQR